MKVLYWYLKVENLSKNSWAWNSYHRILFWAHNYSELWPERTSYMLACMYLWVQELLCVDSCNTQHSKGMLLNIFNRNFIGMYLLYTEMSLIRDFCKVCHVLWWSSQPCHPPPLWFSLSPLDNIVSNFISYKKCKIFKWMILFYFCLSFLL